MFVILFKLFLSLTGNSVIPCYCSLWSVASYLHCLLFSQISFSFWKYPGWHLHVFSEQMAFESPLRVQLLVPVHVEPRTEKQIGVHCMTVLFSTDTWCRKISLSLSIYIYIFFFSIWQCTSTGIPTFDSNENTFRNYVVIHYNTF